MLTECLLIPCCPQAIRKKIEADLNRKAGKPSTPRRGTGPRRGAGGFRPAPVAGTVSALRPLPALTVPQSISVADASQLCAAKRTDCVLVVDDDEHLAGIFTAKDLAFRVSLRRARSWTCFLGLTYPGLTYVPTGRGGRP